MTGGLSGRPVGAAQPASGVGEADVSGSLERTRGWFACGSPDVAAVVVSGVDLSLIHI